MNGSSWSSCRKMTRPFGSSMRLGCTGLKACSGGIGIFFHGCGLPAARRRCRPLRLCVCARTQSAGARERQCDCYRSVEACVREIFIPHLLSLVRGWLLACAADISIRALVRLLSTNILFATRRMSALVTASTFSSWLKSSRQSPKRVWYSASWCARPSLSASPRSRSALVRVLNAPALRR